jgi:hypothetical protein
VVTNITDKQVPVAIKGDAVRLAKCGLHCRLAVSAEARLTGSGYRRDDLRFPVHTPYDVVSHLNKVHVAVTVKTDFVWLIERSFCGWTSIAGVASFARASYRCEDTGSQVEPADHVVIDFAKVQRTVRSGHEAVRIVDLGLRGGTSVTAETGGARTCDCGDGRIRRAETDRGRDGE